MRGLILLLALTVSQLAFTVESRPSAATAFRETLVETDRFVGLRCIFDKLLFPKPPTDPIKLVLAKYGE